MGFSRYLKLILKRFWIVILLEVVTIASTFFYTQSQPVSYTTRATIILNPRVPNSLVPYIDGEATYASGLAENYNLIIKSDKFTRKVQQLLDFPISLEALSNSYSARLAPNSVFYYISATFNSPEKAQKIANAVTKLFLSEGLNQTNPANAKPEDIVDVTVKKQRQELEYVQGQIDSIKAQIVVLQQITPTLNTIENLKQLNQELKDNLDIQSRIVLSITEVEGKNTADKQDSATLIDDAKLPLSPNSNNLMRNLLFAIVLALVLGVGLIVSLDYLDYTVRSSEELAQLTGYSTLGVVPIIRGSNNSGDAASFAADSASGELAKPSAQLITANEFRSAGSEAYRVLRTNILFSALANNSGQNQLVARSAENDSQPPGEPLLKTFLITSAIPKEGKSQTAANLAVVFAQTGSKVILVDTDLRKPTLHTYFGLPNEEGFSNLILSGPSDADTFLKKTTVPNLTLITAGTPPPNPSELLTSVKAALVIKALSDMSDIIIFDSPPAVLVSDAAILANRVDQVLLVFRSGSTRRAAISKAVTNLKKVGATVIGTVLNRVDEKDDGGYYYYGGYDYYAGSKKKNQKLKKAAKKG